MLVPLAWHLANRYSETGKNRLHAFIQTRNPRRPAIGRQARNNGVRALHVASIYALSVTIALRNCQISANREQSAINAFLICLLKSNDLISQK